MSIASVAACGPSSEAQVSLADVAQAAARHDDRLSVEDLATAIIEQRGMFSFSGLTKEQVEELREKHAIYIVGSGRINVAGMTEANMGRLCDAIASVL